MSLHKTGGVRPLWVYHSLDIFRQIFVQIATCILRMRGHAGQKKSYHASPLHLYATKFNPIIQFGQFGP